MVVRKFVGVGIATVGSLALLGTVFGGEKLKLYGKTGERIIEEKIDGACGVPTKLELLKTKVRELDQEVVRLDQDVIARKVELEGAASRVRDSEASVDHQRQVLARAAELLDRGQQTYEICGHSYARAEVEADARCKLDACQAAERAIDDERKIVAVKERTLGLARAHLERATKRRVELAQAVRSLEARVAEQQAKRALADALDQAPMSNEVQTELARAEQLAQEVQSKLAVEERVLDERLAKSSGPTGQIDYEPAKKTEQDVARSIRAHLAHDSTPPEAPAKATLAEPAQVH